MRMATLRSCARDGGKSRLLPLRWSLSVVPRVPGIMVDVDEHGVPIIMQGQGTRSKSSVRVGRASKRAGFPREIPRGSSAYVPPIPLPSSSGRGAGLIAPPSVTPYTPPPISNPSERIGQFNQSFPLNGGLGNNPTDRDAYIRYNFNR